MSNGPQFFQTRYGQDYFNHQLPAQIKAMNRLAEAIEKQNELATPDNEYIVYFKKGYREREQKATVFAKTQDDAKSKLLKEYDYNIYESRVELVKLGG